MAMRLDPDKKVDLLTTLREISDARIEHMQRTIEAHAHRMHYALDDCPGDAIYTFWDNLQSHAPIKNKQQVHKRLSFFKRKPKLEDSHVELRA